MKRIFYLVCLLIAILACKEVFEDPPIALLKASLINSSTQKTISSEVTVQGIGLDSLWIDKNSINEILFPLAKNDTSSFLISFDAKTDTLIFFHETTLKYASMETGFYYEYKLDSIYYTHNQLDSIQITDSLVTKKWHENIKLYIRPLSSGGN